MSVVPHMWGGLVYSVVLQYQYRAGSGSALIETLLPGPPHIPYSEPTAANGADKRGPPPSFDDQNLLYILKLVYI